MLYSDWILFVIYIGGGISSWCWCYTQALEIDRWRRKEDSAFEAASASFLWPMVVVAYVLYLVWRRFRFTIIGLSNLMQREEGS